MIVKFIPKKGSGSCKATMDYLLGRHGNRAGADVLRGDPKLTQFLADSLEFKHKYSVGVLSFQEKDLPDDVKQSIMDDFERTLFCGMSSEQYNICWVQHLDKGRLELNFVVPKVELSTGKALNPYFDSVDKDRVNHFKTYINAHYGLSDPDDPSRKQAIVENQTLPRAKKDLADLIHGGILNYIEQGMVNSRADVLELLEQQGFQIARITDKSISIADPYGGRNLRLKGAIYEKEFSGIGSDVQRELQNRARKYETKRQERSQSARARLDQAIKSKSDYHQERYRQSDRTATKPIGGLQWSYGSNPQRQSSGAKELVATAPKGNAEYEQGVFAFPRADGAMAGATIGLSDRYGVDDGVRNDSIHTSFRNDNKLREVYETVFPNLSPIAERLRKSHEQRDERNAQYHQAKRQYDSRARSNREAIERERERSEKERIARKQRREQEAKSIDRDIENYEQQSAGNDTLTKQLDSELAGRTRYFEVETRDFDERIRRIGDTAEQLKKSIDRHRAEFVSIDLRYAHNNEKLTHAEKEKLANEKPILELIPMTKILKKQRELDHSPSPF